LLNFEFLRYNLLVRRTNSISDKSLGKKPRQGFDFICYYGKCNRAT
jgi:hypothetical protein